MFKLKAWEVLEFCELVHATLAHTEFDDDRPEWKIYWIAGVASLRTVGQVLHKVDGQTDEFLRKIITEKWPQMKAEPIFSDFIHTERNSLLKEFGFGAMPGNAQVTTFKWREPSETVTTYRELFYGDNGRFASSMLAEAIDFWQRHLEDIEQKWEAASLT